MQALGDLGQAEAHVVATQLACLGRLRQRHAGADQQRLDARDGGVHRLGDLLVGEVVDLAQQQRGALRLGKLVHVLEQVAQVGTPVDDVGSRDAVGVDLIVHRVAPVGDGLAQVVQAPVAGDPVEPGPRVDVALVGQHGVVGGGEHLLQDVLGVLLRGQHVPAEGEQPGPVAVEQHLEGADAARPDGSDQPLVRLKPQQRRSASEQSQRGCLGSASFHRGDLRNTVAMRMLRRC